MQPRVVLTLFPLLLAGCGDLSGLGATTEFACKAPIGVHCDSLAGTYYNSLANNLPTQRRHTNLPAALPGQTAILHASTPEVSPSFAPASLRAPGREMRIWVKAWQDDERDLADQSYVYLVVSDGRWRVAHVQQEERSTFARLQPPLPAHQPEPAQPPEHAEPPATPPASVAPATAAPAAVTPAATAPVAEAGEMATK